MDGELAGALSFYVNRQSIFSCYHLIYCYLGKYLLMKGNEGI